MDDWLVDWTAKEKKKDQRNKEKRETFRAMYGGPTTAQEKSVRGAEPDYIIRDEARELTIFPDGKVVPDEFWARVNDRIVGEIMANPPFQYHTANAIFTTPITNTKKEETNMETKSIDDQVAETLRDRQRDAELNRKLALVGEYEEDRFPEKTVLRFDKTFDHGDQTKDYTYTALKTGTDRWYLSSAQHSARPLTWLELVGFLVSGKYPVSARDVEIMQPGARVLGSVVSEGVIRGS